MDITTVLLLMRLGLDGFVFGETLMVGVFFADKDIILLCAAIYTYSYVCVQPCSNCIIM